MRNKDFEKQNRFRQLLMRLINFLQISIMIIFTVVLNNEKKIENEMNFHTNDPTI